MQLLFSGRSGWKNEEFFEALRLFKYRYDVIMLGYLSAEDLAKVTAAAYASVYPSFFEGFGVPPLEAMQCGVPALVSNAGAMPEVCSDAAMYFNPNDAVDIARQMMMIYKDEDLRRSLKEKGQERVKVFPWDKTAQLLWNIILTL